jgi:hypothetical protein
MPWLKLSVTNVSPRRPGLAPGSVHNGICVKVALGQVFLPSSSGFLCQYHSTVGPPLSYIFWEINNRPVGGRS